MNIFGNTVFLAILVAAWVLVVLGIIILILFGRVKKRRRQRLPRIKHSQNAHAFCLETYKCMQETYENFNYYIFSVERAAQKMQEIITIKYRAQKYYLFLSKFTYSLIIDFCAYTDKVLNELKMRNTRYEQESLRKLHKKCEQWYKHQGKRPV